MSIRKAGEEMDSYISAFSSSIKRLEECYGLRGDSKLHTLKMAQFKPRFEQLLDGLSTEDLKQRNQSASTQFAIISYMDFRLKFYGITRLNFTRYKRINEIVRILLPFCNASRISMQNKLAVGELCLMLSEFDEEDATVMQTLSYMYLRIFIVLVLCENYCDASIIADLLLSQLVTYGGSK